MLNAQETLDGEIIVDSFAGGGGASTGIELALGRIVNIAINHDPAAILMHQTNHPHTEHYQASVWDIDPETVCRGRPVALCWFSPDCKHFSKAKGSALVDRNIRGLAWIVLRWAGTVKPRVIILENVEEFQTWGPVRNGKPVKSKQGQTFQRWLWQLKNCGYVVEYRELVAADYGAPTTRKRFVLIARRDGKPIVWPERTHAPADHPDTIAGKFKPWRSAAEIIDWTQPMYSIFATKAEIKARYGVNAVRPLADNTLRRIIRGVDKFTIRSGKPYIVFSNTCNSVGNAADSPVPTIRTGGGGGLLMSAANLIQYHTEQTEAARVNGLTEPMPTVDASNRYGLTAAHLTEYYGNGQPVDLRDPAHTVTAHDREALTAVHIQKYFGGVVGSEVSKPTPTVTAVDHNALSAVHLDKYFGGGYSGCGNRADEPITTITAEPRHSICAAHVVEFKGQDKGQSAADPLRTITAGGGEFGVASVRIERYAPGAELGFWPEIRALLNRFCGYTLKDDEVLLLMIGGTAFYLSDILLRMLTPRELYNAMGFPPDYIIDRDYTGKPYPKSAQVARCGNAVCPPMAKAVVAANLPEYAVVNITTMEQLAEMVAV